MAEFKFEIKEHIGVISEDTKGWKTELNLVSWNGRDPKYDIRSWDENHEKMGKGITLTQDQLATLKGILQDIDL